MLDLIATMLRRLINFKWRACICETIRQNNRIHDHGDRNEHNVNFYRIELNLWRFLANFARTLQKWKGWYFERIQENSGFWKFDFKKTYPSALRIIELSAWPVVTPNCGFYLFLWIFGRADALKIRAWRKRDDLIQKIWKHACSAKFHRYSGKLDFLR